MGAIAGLPRGRAQPRESQNIRWSKWLGTHYTASSTKSNPHRTDMPRAPVLVDDSTTGTILLRCLRDFRYEAPLSSLGNHCIGQAAVSPRDGSVNHDHDDRIPAKIAMICLKHVPVPWEWKRDKLPGMREVEQHNCEPARRGHTFGTDRRQRIEPPSSPRLAVLGYKYNTATREGSAKSAQSSG